MRAPGTPATALSNCKFAASSGPDRIVPADEDRSEILISPFLH